MLHWLSGGGDAALPVSMAMPPSASESPIGATVNLTTMAALVRLKRGSVQLRHAAREVRGIDCLKIVIIYGIDGKTKFDSSYYRHY